MLHCIQNQKEEKKNRRKEDGDKWTRVSEFIETEEEALQGDIKCKEQVKALQLEEGTPEYDAVLWERFLKKWYSSHPEEEAGGTNASEVMRLIKDNIDPHYVWWHNHSSKLMLSWHGWIVTQALSRQFASMLPRLLMFQEGLLCLKFFFMQQ